MPAKAGYDWKCGVPPVLDEHSQVKHQLFRDYVERYLRVLTQNWNIPELKLTLVDAFAGGGEYRSLDGEFCPGSPLILLQAVQAIETELTEDRSRRCRLNVEYFFVDSDPTAISSLQRVLVDRGYGDLLGSRVYIQCGPFESLADGIIDHIEQRKGGHRALFFLDQYGYSDVPLPRIQNIFSRLSGAEVVLTFALDWLIDFISATSAFEKALRRTGIHVDADRLAELKRVCPDAVVEGLMYDYIVTNSGAGYYTPFYLEPRSNRRLWLIHLSNHYRARQEMAAVHWKSSNVFRHFGGAGLDQFAAINNLLLPSSREPGGLSPMMQLKRHLLGFSPRRAEPGKLILPLRYDFGDRARSITARKLTEQIHDLLYESPKISFQTLLENIANHSPADTDLIQDALLNLSDEGRLKLMGPGGGGKKTRTINLNGLVKVPRQLFFDFGG